MNALPAGGRPNPNAAGRVQQLAQFEPISLAAMDSVKLLDRTDTKFVLSEKELLRALAQLGDHYRVLDIDGCRLNHYRTLYFDTADFAMYRRHHAGALNRYKVRSRAYVDSQLAFLEVKFKTHKRRTIKSRLRTADLVTGLADNLDPFLQAHNPYHPHQLEFKLSNVFTRITLVAKGERERLTLDLDLRLLAGGAVADLAGLAIAEVKQPRYSPHSPFVRQMRAANVRPAGFSKYCIGVSLLYPGVKSNNFKPRLLQLEKLLPGVYTHDRFH